MFAGGIGENAPSIRAHICDGLGFLGIKLDEKQNLANADMISMATSRVAIRVMQTDEELMIARMVCRKLRPGQSSEDEPRNDSSKDIEKPDPISERSPPARKPHTPP